MTRRLDIGMHRIQQQQTAKSMISWEPNTSADQGSGTQVPCYEAPPEPWDTNLDSFGFADFHDLEYACSCCQHLSDPEYIDEYDLHEITPKRRCWIRFSDLDVSARKCKVCLLVFKGVVHFNDNMNAGAGTPPYHLSADNNFAIARPQLGYLSVQIFSRRKCLEYNLEILYRQDEHISTIVSIPSKLNLAYTTEILQRWIANCDVHNLCPTPDNPLLPTRVLDLESDNTDLRLLVTNGLRGRYTALSYCWGSGIPFQTTTRTLAAHTAHISFEAVPKTFQDAISITRALGIRYVWIDSLCILQDDLPDWEQEAAKMSQVYSNSYITLAASAGSTPEHGLFSPRWTLCSYVPGSAPYSTASRHQPLSVEALEIHDGDASFFIRPRIHLAHDRFWETDNAEKHLQDAPLLTRAWVFQERLLSTRTVHFHAEELVWECRSGMNCECGGINSHISQAQSGGWLKQSLAVAIQNGDRDALGHVWLDLVSEFSRLHLTKESDRLPALSGLAESFSDTVLGDYVCGIWREDFARGLLFERINPILAQDSEPIFATQPSWSWASIAKQPESAISYDRVLQGDFIQSSHFKVLELVSRTSGSNVYSWISDSRLQVQA